MVYILYVLAITLMVTLDQFSKFLILQKFALGQVLTIINDFFSVTYIQNFGAGFSILQQQTTFLIIVPFIAIGFLLYLLFTSKKEEYLSKIAYLLIIGGTIGNLIDRIRYSYVIDFLDFVIFGYDFPVFNIADCFITVGGILVIISVLKESKCQKLN